MKHRALRSNELTPDARIDAACRTIANAIDELVKARLEKGMAAQELVDQDDSPLGRRRHLELVRAGKLRAARDGRRVLVRRSDIEAYLAEHEVKPRPVTEDDVDGMVRRIAGGRG